MSDYSSKEKEVVREYFTRFISDSFSDNRIRNAKVLTLLGPDNYELEQIWDPLGIKRENITVIENDPKTYELIKSKNLGVKLEDRGSIDEYLQTTKEKFDIINLDYTGYLNDKKISSLGAISQKSLLGDEGILATWYSGKRERIDVYSTITRNYLLEMVRAFKRNDKASNFLNRFLTIDHLKKIREMNNELSAGKIPRDFGLSLITQGYICKGIMNKQNENILEEIIHVLNGEEEVCKAVESTFAYSRANKNLIALLQRNKENTAGFNKDYVATYKNIRSAILRNEKPKLSDRLSLIKYFPEELFKAENDFLEKKINKTNALRGLSSQRKSVLKSMLLSPALKYFPCSNKRLRYIGAGNTPMYVDFTLYKGLDRKKIFPVEIRNDKLKVPSKQMHTAKLWNKIRQYALESAKGISNSLIFPFEDRQHIVVDNPRESLLKEFSEPKLAVEYLLDEGKSYDVINELFPEFSLTQLPRIKAVMTMKANNIQMGRPKKKEESKTPLETSSSNDLTNDDILFLLDDDYSPSEISETFGVNVWRVRGLKANLTKKKNSSGFITS